VVVGAYTILIVEDSRVVRRVTNRMLTEEGYRVLEAADAEEALEILGMPRARVDLVLLDVVLPDTDGVALFADIRNRFPGVPVVFMSAYPAEILAAHGQDDLNAPFLGKPYTRAELIEKVGRAIEGRHIPRAGVRGNEASES
jgi:two-component system cell cycle sensor histidine kinase/response regulator CckA